MNFSKESCKNFRLLAAALALAAGLMSLATLLVWLIAPSYMSGIHSGHIWMAPGTALALLALSLLLLVRVYGPPGKYGKYLAGAGCVLIAVFSLAVLAQYLFGWEGGLYDLLPASRMAISNVPANSTSPMTAASLFLASVSMLFLYLGATASKATTASVVLSLLAGLNALVVGFAYLFSVPLLHNGRIIPMTFLTAVATIILCLGLLAAVGPASWPLRFLVGPTLRARLLRVFLPLTVIIVMVEGWVIHMVHSYTDSFNPALVSSSLALVFIIISGLLVVRLVQVIDDSIDHADMERRLAETDLGRSEERLRGLFDSSPISIWEEDFSRVKAYIDNLRLRDTEDLEGYFDEHPDEVFSCASMVRVIDVNQVTLDMYEAGSKEELLLGLTRVFTEETQACFKSNLIAICEGEASLEVETVTQTLKGRRMDSIVRWSVVPGFEDSLSRVLISITDITRLKRSEEDLRTKTRQLETSQRVARLGSWEWDMAGDNITWSDELYRIFGIDPQTFKSTYEAVLDMIHPLDRDRLDRAVKQAIDERSHYKIDVRVVRGDGSEWMMEALGEVICDEAGKPIRISGTAQDITERQRVEEEISRSEQRFRDLFEGAPDAIYLADPETGLLVGANEAAAELVKRSVNELIGMHQSQLHPAEMDDCSQQVFQQHIRESIENGKVAPTECEVIRSDGVRVPVEITAQMIYHQGKPVFQGTFRDITERKQAEDAIRASEMRYRELFEQATDGIFVIDADTSEIIDVNTFALDRLGYSKEEMIGMKVTEINPPEVPLAVKKRVERQAAGETTTFDTLHKRKDGSWMPVEITSRMITHGDSRIFQAIVRDITERKQAEVELRESEENYRALFEESPFALAIHSNDIIVNTNQAAADLMGAGSPEELIGGKVIEFVHPDYREMASERMKAVLYKEARFPVVEEKFIKLDGSVIDVEISAMTVNYKGEKAVQVAFQDVTERKQLEEQLRQAQKMESVGTMAGGIAHDFNNYLTAIEGYIDLVLMDIPENDPVREELLEARRSADRAANLTRQLLLFSRREPMDLRPTDLSRVISDIQKMMDRLLGERYTLALELKESAWTVKADAGHLEQVIMNLIVNARDAMPGGGEIRISTENVQVDDDYAREHSDATVGSYVCLIVSDEGSGMDKQTLSHIFDPFFSTKSGKEGTGLGLSVVYGIVSQHGGWIDADSSPGRGAVFRVFIPAMPMEREQEPGVQGLVEDLKGNGERVLLVEDESAVRALANRLLSEHGYQVYAAGDADEAGSIFEKEKGDFDLVFSDVVLPGEDGISFVGRLRRQRPELRVLLASGYSGDETNRVEIEQHGYRFMQKPYSLKVLMKTIKDVLGDTNS
ncbi:blue-light-activated protein [bacterium BMS3Abin01]|nr:blue-light-activated protein [bacterium BMS3Abin01]